MYLQSYTYTQSNGVIVSIIGTGNYIYNEHPTAINSDNSIPNQYNCILFDIELATKTGIDTVQVSDFLNLYKYIKQLYPYMIIITAISHNCSYYITELSSEIVKSDLSDYIVPILYSQMFGTTTEYCALYNLSWDMFFDNLLQNKKFIRYGLNYLLPSIYAGYSFTVNGTPILDMYKNGGTNSRNSPNLYYYQSSANTDNTVIESYSGQHDSLGFIKQDNGVVDFFNKLTKYYSIKTQISQSEYLGGFIQWNNFQSS